MARNRISGELTQSPRHNFFHRKIRSCVNFYAQKLQEQILKTHTTKTKHPRQRNSLSRLELNLEQQQQEYLGKQQ